MFAMAGVSCYILADTFFISKGLGANGLAALNIAIPVYSFIHGTALMLGMGGATRYSVEKSRGNEEKASEAFSFTVISAILFSFLFLLTGIFLSEPITSLLGADSEIFGMTSVYIKILLLFSPAFIFNEVILCFVRNDNAPGLAMAATLTGSLFNILFDYILVFPLNMGITGAVLATGFSPVVGLVVLSSHIIKKKNGFHLKKIKFSFKTPLNICVLGCPSLISELSSGVAIIVYNMLILGLMGNLGIAAYGIIANVSIVATAFFTGIAQGTQPLVSRAFGSGDRKSAKETLRYAVIFSVILSAVIYLLLFVFAEQTAGVFNGENNGVLQATAVNGIKIYFTAIIFAGLNIILSVFFTSAERPVPAYIITLTRGLFVLVPTAVILSVIFKINGVWASFAVTEFIVLSAAVAMLFVFLKKTEKKGK